MRRATVGVGILIVTLSAGTWITGATGADPITVTVEQTVYFSAPDGADVAIPPGRYQVLPEESHLLLLGSDGQHRQLIQASPVRHQHEIATAVGYAIHLVPDRYQVMFLDPGGRGLIAQGSAGEVRARGPGLLKTDVAGALGNVKAFTPPTDRELLQEALAKLDALTKQVGPIPQMAQQVNDLQSGKMGFLIQETNRQVYRVCEIVGAHMWGGPAIGCIFGKR